MTIDDLLNRARANLDRVTPQQAAEAMRDRGAVLIDIRSESQRARGGLVPGGQVNARHVLGGRGEPDSGLRGGEGAGAGGPLIGLCNGGHPSSVAAAPREPLRP